MELDGLPNDLSNASALNIYRLIQEVISNSLKHGKAKKIEVLSYMADNFLFLEINDNGAGFDSENQSQNLPGLGLKNIGNRVRYLQGKFEVYSTKGQGTKIKLKFDLDKLP
jgi:signal transduction histidine kinase